MRLVGIVFLSVLLGSSAYASIGSISEVKTQNQRICQVLLAGYQEFKIAVGDIVIVHFGKSRKGRLRHKASWDPDVQTGLKFQTLDQKVSGSELIVALEAKKKGKASISVDPDEIWGETQAFEITPEPNGNLPAFDPEIVTFYNRPVPLVTVTRQMPLLKLKAGEFADLTFVIPERYEGIGRIMRAPDSDRGVIRIYEREGEYSSDPLGRTLVRAHIEALRPGRARVVVKTQGRGNEAVEPPYQVVPSMNQEIEVK